MISTMTSADPGQSHPTRHSGESRNPVPKFVSCLLESFAFCGMDSGFRRSDSDVVYVVYDAIVLVSVIVGYARAGVILAA